MSFNHIRKPFVFDFLANRIRDLPIGSRLTQLPFHTGVVGAFLSNPPELKGPEHLNRGDIQLSGAPLDMESQFIARFLALNSKYVALFESFFDAADLTGQ
jgi:hypothetical protein